MNSTKTILIIDDDATLRETLVEQLRFHDEFDCAEAGDGAAGLAFIHENPVDIVLLDVNLPDMAGHEVCRLVREEGLRVPVIMLAGDGTDVGAVPGLEEGANDFLIKPFRFAALLVRIRTLIRQHEQSEDVVLRIGPYEFNPGLKLLVEGEERKIRLTEKEAAILKFLFHAGGETVPRDVLLHEVWGYHSGVTTHTLETHIYRLRQKIEADPSNAEILLTEPGGYRLAA